MSMRAPSYAQSSKATAGLKPAVPRGPRRTILHLCVDLEPADPGREAVDLAVLTQRSGGKALIASSGGLLVTEAERAAVRHTRLPLDGRGLFAGWRNRMRLAALIQRERPALIHAHGIDTLALALTLHRSHRLPVALDITEPLAVTPRTQRLFSELTNLNCLIRVPSEYMVIRLLEDFHVPSKQIRHIPPGVDFQLHNSLTIGAERLQILSRLWRLPEQATVAIVPMPLRPGMGHDVFLEALASLKDENIYAVMVGSDRHAPGRRTELENEIARLELNGKVVMPEFCTDWPTAFWLAGVVVAPNGAPCGQNRALLTAQAVGRPVIVTNTGANVEMVRSGETAWMVPPGDARALATALRETVHLNTSQRLGLAECTRHFVAEQFPQYAWFDETMDMYEALTHGAVRESRAAVAA